jgi:uncharacterized protein YdhG (YjbR/CyaY superfamily)
MSAAKDDKGFTKEEKAAMRERAKELKAAANAAEAENAVLEKIAEMEAPDRALAERLHAIVKKEAPGLVARTWYGMPAYANAAGKIVCFFQSAGKFDARYATLGFNDSAALDDGDMWPTAYALTALSPEVEARVGALVRRAAGGAR